MKLIEIPIGFAEKARALDAHGYSEHEIAEFLRVSVRTLRKYRSLLTLPAEVQRLLREEKLTATVGYELARNPKALKAFLRRNGGTAGIRRVRFISPDPRT